MVHHFNLVDFSNWLLSELTGNPINVALLLAIVFLLYKILKPEAGEKLN